MRWICRRRRLIWRDPRFGIRSRACSSGALPGLLEKFESAGYVSIQTSGFHVCRWLRPSNEGGRSIPRSSCSLSRCGHDSGDGSRYPISGPIRGKRPHDIAVRCHRCAAGVADTRNQRIRQGHSRTGDPCTAPSTSVGSAISVDVDGTGLNARQGEVTGFRDHEHVVMLYEGLDGIRPGCPIRGLQSSGRLASLDRACWDESWTALEGHSMAEGPFDMKACGHWLGLE